MCLNVCVCVCVCVLSFVVGFLLRVCGFAGVRGVSVCGFQGQHVLRLVCQRPQVTKGSAVYNLCPTSLRLSCNTTLTRIRKVSPLGCVTTFAGSGLGDFQDGPLSMAEFDHIR